MTTRFALLLCLLLAACATETDEAATTPAPSVSNPEPVAETPSAEVTPAYLAGPWCFAYYEAGGEREEERITYEFAEDGTLRYQNNPTTPVEQEGSYTIEAGLLVIRPTLMALPAAVVSAEDDTFTLGRGSTRVVFERGPCA